MTEALHVEVHPGRGPPLLLVHGICSSRAQWRPNLAGLAAVCTPVVIELLGHGRSPSPDDPAEYVAAAYFERFEAIRQGLGAERWAVCGQSFGAGLTMGYAFAFPERVTAQVFTNSNSALGPVRPPLPAQEQAVRIAAFERRGRAALETLNFYPKRTGRLAAEVEDELVADAALIILGGMARTFMVTSPSLSMSERLGRITTPTLLVNGRREKSFQPRRDEAAAGIAGLEIVDLEGGHPVNLDCAEAFNAAVGNFLAKHA